MQQTEISLDQSLADLSAKEWLSRLEAIAEAHGTFQKLGKRHVAALIEKGDTLLVTFETMQGIRGLSDTGQPVGWHMSRNADWSHLCIACDGDTWFRDREVYAYFDRLIDDGFFDEFDTVLFYGAGPCGYAAAAYSVAAPGARVLTVQPQATLDPRVTEWDDRFLEMRRTDFTARYGYAPDMLDAARQAYVLYDPSQRLDAMHAALFTRANVTKFRMRHMGDAIQGDLLEMDQLYHLLTFVAQDRLSTLNFARIFRARRNHPPYLRRLMAALEKDDRDILAVALARNVVGRMKAPRFQRRLSELEAKLGNS